jgi:type IV pilus assembly protein PilW
MSARFKIQLNCVLSKYSQSGFTLIELLVAMSLTLLISAGAAALFANTILSTKTLNSATAINEESVRINALLARHIRMAGYVDWLGNSTAIDAITINEAANSNSYNLKLANQVSMFQYAFAADQLPASLALIPPSLSGCENIYSENSNLLRAGCSATALNTASALTVAYQVSTSPVTGFSAVLPASFFSRNGMSGDCLGQSTPVPYAVNRFFLRASTSSGQKTGEPIIYDLMCLGNGNTTPQPLATNIQQWVVRYGVPNSVAVNNTATTNDAQITRYLTAREVTTAGAWNQVMAIRSCFLLVGERGSATVTKGQTNITQSNRLDCLGNKTTIGLDLRLRQAFTQTIALRNQIHTPNLAN